MDCKYKNCNDEVSVILTGRLTLLIPQLELDLQKQLDVKRAIDEILYRYEVTTKETSLVTSDIRQKASLYIACKKLEGLSKGTIYNYSIELDKFDKYFNKPVSTINSMDIRMYMGSLIEGRAEATVNTKMTPIRDFFSWLQNEEYIIANPTKKVKAIKEPKRERVPLTNEQVELLRESLVDKRDKAIVEFMLSTGCRIGELVGVKISDIDWSRKTLLVIGKGDKERRIYFNDRAKIYMKKYIKERLGNSEYLICSNNKPYNQISVRGVQKVVSRIKDASGIDANIHAHIFRHTFATHALDTTPIDVVQKILGHGQISTTQGYCHTKQSNVEYLYKKINI